MSKLLTSGDMCHQWTLQLMQQIQECKTTPGVVGIQVGNLAASRIYLRKKQELAHKLGMHFQVIQVTTQAELLARIDQANVDPAIHGIMVQLPLPAGWPTQQILDTIVPTKDVDGLTSASPFLAATPKGVLHFLERRQIHTQGRHVVILGKSKIVGRPLASQLADETTWGATVTQCDRHTPRPLLHALVAQADVLIVATGKHHLIDGSFAFQPHCIIIDVGFHRIRQPDGSVRPEGDVDLDAVQDKIQAITAIPGCVGPLTCLALMANVVAVARHGGFHVL